MILKMLLGVSVLLQSNLAPLPALEETSQPVPKQFVTVKSKYELALEEEAKWHRGLATAYYNGKDEMNGILGITSSGYDLDNGYIYKGYRILASDKQYLFGTLIDIKLMDGTLIHGIVLDRGGAINGSGRFDIVFRNNSECINFGKQNITYKVRGKINV